MLSEWLTAECNGYPDSIALLETRDRSIRPQGLGRAERAFHRARIRGRNAHSGGRCRGDRLRGGGDRQIAGLPHRDERPPRLVASGDKRVTKRRRQRQSERKFDVRMPISCAKQSFAIGGVPPVGHARPPIVLIDETLLRFDNIWAADRSHLTFNKTASTSPASGAPLR